MSSVSSDSWLWEGLVILGYFGSLAVHRQLVAIRQASQVTRHDKRPNISRQTEDALKLKALGELTQSPDQNIRNASLKIIIDRAIRDGPAWDMMLHDIASKDLERRDKMLTCLRFLLPSFELDPRKADNLIRRLSTYKAIVDCLCNLLPEAQVAERDSALRTQPERDALYILYQFLLMDSQMEKALEAGVISRWLAHYPFGGADASVQNKKKTIRKLTEDRDSFKDSEFRQTMRKMLSVLSDMPEMRTEMVKHGLLDGLKGNDITVEDDWYRLEAPPRTYSQYAHFNRSRRGSLAGISNRTREEVLEQVLRRQRREAMVVGEVGRPIERADIIERGSPGPGGFMSQLRALLDDESEDGSEQSPTIVPEDEIQEELESLVE